MAKSKRNIALVIVLLFGLQTAAAEQRALLVGVGNYQNPKLNLPGIDLDINRMTDTLMVMGFEESQIQTLEDSAATAQNVMSAFETWLVEGVEPDDRVVFYFSGHGSQIPDENGDEADNVDEVLVTYDMRGATINGKKSLVGVVNDDQIAALIDMSPSENMLFIVDACHSGTVTRDIFQYNKSLTDEIVYDKAYVYDEMPVGSDTGIAERVLTGRSEVEAPAESYVAISAARDNERALGTSRGGVFTIGFSDALVKHARAGNQPTINRLRDEAAEYIKARVDPDRLHNPQVTGNSKLADGAFRIKPLQEGHGPIWQRLESIAAEGKSFETESDKESYALGELIQFSLDVPESGYLNLVSVDAADTATVIFPNQYDDDNYVESGQFLFPTKEFSFDFEAARPTGPNLVVAFITEEPVNFRDDGFAGRNADGSFDESALFTDLSYSAIRGIAVVAKPPEPPPPPPKPESEALPEPTVEETMPPVEPVRPSLYSSTLVITVMEP